MHFFFLAIVQGRSCWEGLVKQIIAYLRLSDDSTQALRRPLYHLSLVLLCQVFCRLVQFFRQADSNRHVCVWACVCVCERERECVCVCENIQKSVLTQVVDINCQLSINVYNLRDMMRVSQVCRELQAHLRNWSSVVIQHGFIANDVTSVQFKIHHTNKNRAHARTCACPNL